MTDNNHSEETGKEAARLFKEAHQIEPLVAEFAAYGSTRSEEEKLDLLKNIISGEYAKRANEISASDKVAENLEFLAVIGDLLSATDDSLADTTVPVVGSIIWKLANEAGVAMTISDTRLQPIDVENKS